jgi:transcriptional regulator GlxA family with amidase domain
MRRIIIIGFPLAQSLDIVGPAEVFASASRVAKARYQVIVASSRGGAIKTSSTTIATIAVAKLRPTHRDTVLVAGGSEDGLRTAMQDARLLTWIRRAQPIVERLGSICSGAFILATLGLLDGKRATTHWSAIDRLRRFRPAIHIDDQAIFIRDTYWTSAGVTTGIDMALAMVEHDHGTKTSNAVAATLVLATIRPGFQSQFSPALVAQQQHDDPLAMVIARARSNVKTLSISAMAHWAGLSQRTFHRRCVALLSLTPARLIRKLRVEAARSSLTTSDKLIKTIAHQTGFPSDDAMASAFRRELGLLPHQVRQRRS